MTADGLDDSRVPPTTRESPFEAWLYADGATIALICRRCDDVHRHRRGPNEFVGSLCNRRAHCESPDAPDGVWFHVAGILPICDPYVDDDDFRNRWLG